MKNKIQEYIQLHSLMQPDDKVIVAVSGGADSCVLLHLLLSLNYHCVVAHCNFHLRGEESMRDEHFVTMLTQKYNCKLYKTDFDTYSYAETHKISVEMAARELRYNWFEEIRQTENAACIAVAHHSDDVVETILMNLTRGAGVNGLTGIKPRNGYVVRPLLSVSRNDVMMYVNLHKLDYVTDSTNVDTRFTRNRFREQIIPAFEQLNPSFSMNVIQTAEKLQDAATVYNMYVADACKEVVHKHLNQVFISIEKLLQYKIPKSILYEIIKEYGFNSAQNSAIFRSLQGESGRRFFSSDYMLLKDRSELIISEKMSEDEQYLIFANQGSIDVPLQMKLEKIVYDEHFRMEKNPDIALLDYDKLNFPLTLRHWSHGDVFFPLGMKCKKKLSDYFVDNKYTRTQKDLQWLLISDNQIIWVIGKRIDDRFKITDKTKNILKIIC